MGDPRVDQRGFDEGEKVVTDRVATRSHRASLIPNEEHDIDDRRREHRTRRRDEAEAAPEEVIDERSAHRSRRKSHADMEAAPEELVDERNARRSQRRSQVTYATDEVDARDRDVGDRTQRRRRRDEVEAPFEDEVDQRDRDVGDRTERRRRRDDAEADDADVVGHRPHRKRRREEDEVEDPIGADRNGAERSRRRSHVACDEYVVDDDRGPHRSRRRFVETSRTQSDDGRASKHRAADDVAKPASGREGRRGADPADKPAADQQVVKVVPPRPTGFDRNASGVPISGSSTTEFMAPARKPTGPMTGAALMRKEKGQGDEGRVIFVSHLPVGMDVNIFRQTFGTFGTIINVKIFSVHDTMNLLVEYSSKVEADLAQRMMHTRPWCGTSLNVKKSHHSTAS